MPAGQDPVEHEIDERFLSVKNLIERFTETLDL